MLGPLRIAYLNENYKLMEKILKKNPKLCNLNTLLWFYKKACNENIMDLFLIVWDNLPEQMSTGDYRMLYDTGEYYAIKNGNIELLRIIKELISYNDHDQFMYHN